jgi:hypothetical protein
LQPRLLHWDAQRMPPNQNGDGKVSVAEFKDALPVPNTAVAQQVLHMVQASRDAQAVKAGAS